MLNLSHISLTILPFTFRTNIGEKSTNILSYTYKSQAKLVKSLTTTNWVPKVKIMKLIRTSLKYDQ